MPLDPVALKAELTGDPENLGYAPLLTLGDHTALVGLLNDPAGPGSATIALTSVSRNDFLKAIRPAFLSLPTLSAALQAKWDRILSAIYTGGNIEVDATTQGLLAVAVADGVLTQDQANAAWHRTGSRAEVLFGAGAVAALDDVSRSLRGE